MSQVAIHRDRQIRGGVPVFVGTRVPLEDLLDSLEAGDSLDQFLLDYRFRANGRGPRWNWRDMPRRSMYLRLEYNQSKLCIFLR